ncbi:DUF202 domain-containing protein [Hoeflea sp.]|uniref:DUF202 domain-containing protein n=1 Tax=Hoeflea sp. TaxID=1940281 RepID=UPI003B01821F
MDTRERRSVENLVLAIVRTELANRRTLLSYLNTSIALFVSGAGLLRLSGSAWLEWIGIALMPVSLVVAVIGIVDYSILRRSIEAEKIQAAADDIDA